MKKRPGKNRKRKHAEPASHPGRGAPLTLAPLKPTIRRSIRHIAKELVGQHSTEIALRLREGMLSENLRLALKYLTFVGDRTDGRPVETHRMVGLQDGPTGSYDLSKLDPTQQKELLRLLKSAKDTTEPKGEA
jgi:hypothetical protein